MLFHRSGKARSRQLLGCANPTVPLNQLSKVSPVGRLLAGVNGLSHQVLARIRDMRAERRQPMAMPSGLDRLDRPAASNLTRMPADHCGGGNPLNTLALGTGFPAILRHELTCPMCVRLSARGPLTAYQNG